MKPPQFEYEAPSTIAETLELLDRFGDDAKVLAGGQSLMPLLNFRLARPAVVVDINRVRGLARLDIGPDGVRVGATVRQRDAERHLDVAAANPLLAEALPLIGHFQIRNRGTVCGSLAHADPAAELPAVAVALDAEMEVQRRHGKRTVPADAFFVDALTTSLAPNELLSATTFPIWRGGDGWAIEEFSRRSGDFAVAGAVAVIRLDGGVCAEARLVAFGLGGSPQRLTGSEAAIRGGRIDDGAIERAVVRAREEARADGDIHGSAAYRAYVVGSLAGRAVRRAAARARAGTAS
jgi:carbon-monoxide dehydrogenase medium subunit